ncbi:MAG TPA: hypothetical protein VGL56_07845 [Fimbriimonadaceae bacterium]
MKLWPALLLGCSVAAAQKGQQASHKIVAKKANCAFAGQFYNVEDPKKTAWLGFRFCNFSTGTHASLSVTSGSWKGSFSLPFSNAANAGPGWQRISREKSGCDLVLVKTGVTAKATACTWSVAAASLSGKIVFKPKLWRPFSPPSSRIIQRHKPIKSLKGFRPAQKAPQKH